jgi:hypothetical protein
MREKGENHSRLRQDIFCYKGTFGRGKDNISIANHNYVQKIVKHLFILPQTNTKNDHQQSHANYTKADKADDLRDLKNYN